MNALFQFKRASDLKWKQARHKVVASCWRLDRFCAKLNNGLAAVVIALLVAVVIADSSYIMNVINDLQHVSDGATPLLLGP